MAISTGLSCQAIDDEQAPGKRTTNTSAITVRNGLYVNGLGSNGLYVNGLPLNGLYVNGLPLNGLPLNGLYVNGLYVNGLPLNGLYVNGLYVNGLYVNGLYVNGLPLNGLPLNGLYVNGLYVNGLPVNGATEGAVLGLFEGLAACALGSDQNLVMTDLGGTQHTYPGLHGMDVAWGNGLPTPSLSGAVAQCMIDHYDATFDASLSANNFKLVMQYLVECALPEGVTVTITDVDGTSLPFTGALGLAPEWATGAPTLQSQELVSACLGARTNALGTHVQLSLRGGNIPVSSLERQQYRRYEGAFWGNFFSATPTMNVCEVDGGGMAGRLCTEGMNCGFTYHGACPTSCANPDGTNMYTACGGSTSVLSTYLPFESVVAGSGDSGTICTRLGDTTARCWGSNSMGSLGIGTEDLYAHPTPTTLLEAPGVPLQKIMAIHAGWGHMCARLQDGSNRCWGNGSLGQLGDSASYLPDYHALYASVSSGTDVATLGVGATSNCYLKADGTVWCWGKSGMVGNGAGTESVPVQVLRDDGSPLAGVAKVEVSGTHACALRIDGSVWCWGDNRFGQLGLAFSVVVSRSFPTLVSVVPLIDVAVNDGSTCGIDEAGDVWCWGSNGNGILGDGTTNDRFTPEKISSFTAPATSIVLGQYLACARLSNGTASCWGRNDLGQCGHGTTQPNTSGTFMPVQVLTGPSTALSNVEEVTLNGMTGFALVSSGLLYAWGANTIGQLGLGSFDYDPHPYAAKVLNHTCGDYVCNNGESLNTCPADCDASPPSTPTGLVASGITASSITLSWTASTDNLGVTGYSVLRQGLPVATVAGTSYTFTGLPCGSHTLTVQAHDAAGNSSSQATAINPTTTACPDTTPPTTPTGLTVSTITQSSMTFSWSASTDNVRVAGYKVYRNGTQVATSYSNLIYWASGLPCGTTYTFSVNAFDPAGNNSPQATPVSGTTNACADTTPPTTPTGLVVSAATQTSLTLSWASSTDNVGVSGYQLYQDGVQVSIESSSLSHTFSYLACGTGYTLTVSAFDAVGNQSAVAAPIGGATTACADSTAPSTPTGLVASSITQTGFTLGWTPATDNVAVSGYRVFLDGSQVATVATNSYLLSGGNCGRSHALTVQAYDTAGNNSALAAPIDVTTVTCSVGIGTESAIVDTNTVGRAEAVKYTSSSVGASINKLCIFLDATSSASQIVLGLYSTKGSGQGHPYQRKTFGTIAAPVANAWNCVAVTPFSVAAKTKYWLAVLQPSGSTGTIQFRDGASGQGMEWMTSGSISALPATWPTSNVSSNASGDLSFFAAP